MYKKNIIFNVNCVLDIILIVLGFVGICLIIVGVLGLRKVMRKKFIV